MMGGSVAEAFTPPRLSMSFCLLPLPAPAGLLASEIIKIRNITQIANITYRTIKST